MKFYKVESKKYTLVKKLSHILSRNISKSEEISEKEINIYEIKDEFEQLLTYEKGFSNFYIKRINKFDYIDNKNEIKESINYHINDLLCSYNIDLFMKTITEMENDYDYFLSKYKSEDKIIYNNYLFLKEELLKMKSSYLYKIETFRYLFT